MNKINENTKITLTVGQLKKLIKESRFDEIQLENDLANYFATKEATDLYYSYVGDTYSDILDQIADDGFEVVKDICNGDILVVEREGMVCLVEIDEDDESGWIGTSVELTGRLKDSVQMLGESDEGDSSENWCVVCFGGSIGRKFTHRFNGKPCVIYKDGLTEEKAREEVKIYRKLQSPGDREYYGYTYKAVPENMLKPI